ncbi:MAG TPA: Fe(3+) ABC transporter substrate-binding protein [Geminicoccaceae bacterium]|nr:Fe(3+) ABC transporter substrate-binding protein [Geminicoccaceae bacterium]
MSTRRFMLGAASCLGLLAGAASAAEVNVYSARHYDTDAQLYSDFTKETGIEINLIEGNAEELVERIKLEGANSPADVLITVDAGRLWRADQEGVFQPLRSAVLEERIPAEFRHPDGDWFGYTTRARLIFYNKETADPALAQTYEDLARPELEGELCIRSSSNIYNLSLMGSLIEHLGEDAAAEWAKGVAGNLARPPEGGDTDQIVAVANGLCDFAVANHYYYVRLMTSDDPADREVAAKVGVIFPNQADRGTHVNISGAGMVATSPNPENARAFLEYLASDSAQTYFIAGNSEFPTVPGVAFENPALEEIGAMDFKRDTVPVAVFGENQPLAQVLMDEAGWK